MMEKLIARTVTKSYLPDDLRRSWKKKRKGKGKGKGKGKRSMILLYKTTGVSVITRKKKKKEKATSFSLKKAFQQKGPGGALRSMLVAD